MRVVIKILLLSIAIGFVINVPFVGYDIYKDLFRSDVFERLNIGTSKVDAIKVLEERKVWCELLDQRFSTCHFSDYWRDYSVAFDPSTAAITERSYRNRSRHSILHPAFR